MNIEDLVRPSIKQIHIYEPGQEQEGYIKLASNENPHAPHPRVVEAVVAELARANRYPLSGSPELVRALARRHDVETGEVMVGNGSNEIIDLLVRAFVQPGQNVVFPTPSFIVYALIPLICGVEGRGVLCKDYRLDLAAMRAAMDAQTRMVFVCNPNNPTSTYVTAAQLDAFLEDLPENVLVVMDEAYVDYVDAADYPDSLALRQRRNTLVALRTFSKFHSIAGLRVGYAIADPAVVDVLHRVRQPFNVNRLAQAAALAALGVADEIRPRAREVIAERERVGAVLRELGVACPPSQANFVFADLGDSGLDLHEALYAHGIIVRRMGQFGSTTNSYRVSLGTRAENDRLIAALREVLGRA
jgi:histidinol-phosphate aminotransferase